jgi:hypothetical protein
MRFFSSIAILQQAQVDERTLLFNGGGLPELRKLTAEPCEQPQAGGERWDKFSAAGRQLRHLRFDALDDADLRGQPQPMAAVTGESLSSVRDTRRTAVARLCTFSRRWCREVRATREQINAITEELDRLVAEIGASAQRSARQALILVVLTGLASIVLGIVLTYSVGVRVSQRLRALIAALSSSANETTAAANLITTSSQTAPRARAHRRPRSRNPAPRSNLRA